MKAHRTLKYLGIAVVMILLGFIVLPAVVVMMTAFNNAAMLAFPPQEWSLRWFERALTYRDFRHGFVNGAIIMMFTSVLAVLIGATFAYVIDRYQFFGRAALETILLSPLVIPNFTIGIAFLIFAAQSGMMRTYTVVVTTHIVLVLPFVLRSVYISLKNIDRRLELAAAGLGASPFRVLYSVTLPLLAPGLFAGWLFAAILSFNEFTASLFVTAQRGQRLAAKHPGEIGLILLTVGQEQ
jgi:putative spermidine/putrescine transport system permease protein